MEDTLMINFKPKGVCSRQINFEVEGNILTKLEFVGGCAGNTAGVSRLAVGRDIDEIISLTKAYRVVEAQVVLISLLLL